MMNFIFLLVGASLSLALSSPNESIDLTSGNLTLRGQRYLNAEGRANSGPRVLLTHGLTSNFHEFERIATFLTEQGYDCYAFNFGGHGNGLQRSEIQPYTNGDYSFDKLAERDFPLMVDFVGENGKYPVTVIGHSMGGMVPRASIAEGFVSPSKISKMVLIGSPSTFDQTTMPWEVLDPLSLRELPLWFGAGDRPILGSGVFSIGAELLSMSGNPLIDWLARGVVRRENLGTVDRWKDLATSRDTPKDIFRSFANFRSKRFKYEDAPLPVPALHIMGSDDWLAPWRDVHRKALIQSKDSQAWFVLMDKVSHIDLVAEKPLRSYADVLLSFLNSPESLGENYGFLRRAMDCESSLVNAGL